MEEARTTGTPEQVVGDAAEQTPTTGTPATEGRDAEPNDIAKLNLEWKAKAERVNELEKKLAELESREPSPAAPAEEDDVDWNQVEDYARRSDQVAKAQLRAKRERDELIYALTMQNQLQEIDDKEERKQARELFLKNRQQYGSVAAAHDAIKLKKAVEDNERLRQELKRASVNRPDPNVVRTEERDMTRSEVQTGKMTPAQWDNEQRRLNQAWEAGDVGAAKESRRLQWLRSQGKLVVKE